MSRIIIDRQEFIMLEAEAKKDFYYWETINKAKKEKQCFNSIRSCRVGVFCEYSIQKHLLKTYGRELLGMVCYGRKERTKSIHFRSKPDIHIETKTKDFKIEIKGISEGQPKGQILTYHGDKYHKNEFTHVAFCELFYNEKAKKAVVEIYLIDQLKNIIKYPIAKNKFGKECYTAPKYLHVVKAHK